jgi:hypothetical protein
MQNILKPLLLTLFFISFAFCLEPSSTGCHEHKRSGKQLDIFDRYNLDKVNISVLYLLRNDTQALNEIVAKDDFDVFSESQIILGDEKFTGKKYSFFRALLKEKRYDILDKIFAKLPKSKLQNNTLQYAMYESIRNDMESYRYLLLKGVLPLYKNEFGDTTLTDLAQFGTLEDFKNAISLGATVDTTNPFFIQNSLYGKKYDTVRFLLDNYPFDLNTPPKDNIYFPTFLFYLVSIDSTNGQNKEFFQYLLGKFNDATIQKYGDEFIKRL